MVFGRKQQPYQKSAPTEVVELTPSLKVAIWNVPGEGRDHPIHFSLERIAADGKSRRTLRPENLLELPLAIGVLCSALSKSRLPDSLRASLKNLSDRLYRVAKETEGQNEPAPLDNGESLFG